VDQVSTSNPANQLSGERGTNEKFLFKEIDIIQDIIKRMSSNCFLIKGWTITLVLIVMILSGSMAKIFLSSIPTFLFWGLDSFYLRKERLYRKRYDWLIKNRFQTLDHLLDMKTDQFSKEVSRFRTAFSASILPFYASVIASFVIVSSLSIIGVIP
jgi:hypothetical protein